MDAAEHECPPGCRRRRWGSLVGYPDSTVNTPAGEHTPLQAQLPLHQLDEQQPWVPAVQNLKRSGDLKKGVWILAAGVLTMKCLMAGFRSLVRPICCSACYHSMLLV